MKKIMFLLVVAVAVSMVWSFSVEAGPMVELNNKISLPPVNFELPDNLKQKPALSIGEIAGILEDMKNVTFEDMKVSKEANIVSSADLAALQLAKAGVDGKSLDFAISSIDKALGLAGVTAEVSLGEGLNLGLAIASYIADRANLLSPLCLLMTIDQKIKDVASLLKTDVISGDILAQIIAPGLFTKYDPIGEALDELMPKKLDIPQGTN